MAIMKATDYPCWLSQKDLHIAQALVEKAGFIYCGKDEDFIPYDEELGTGYKLAKCCGWQLASAYSDVALEALRDGAVFGKCLEVLPDDAVKEPAAAIEEALIEDQEPEPVQITVKEPTSVVEEAPESLSEPTIEELLQDIALDTLQLRPARKICGKLGIQQKVNGKDAPLSWLRAQIKGRLTEKPQETAPVIMSVLKAS